MRFGIKVLLMAASVILLFSLVICAYFFGYGRAEHEKSAIVALQCNVKLESADLDIKYFINMDIGDYSSEANYKPDPGGFNPILNKGRAQVFPDKIRIHEKVGMFVDVITIDRYTLDYVKEYSRFKNHGKCSKISSNRVGRTF